MYSPSALNVLYSITTLCDLLTLTCKSGQLRQPSQSCLVIELFSIILGFINNSAGLPAKNTRIGTPTCIADIPIPLYFSIISSISSTVSFNSSLVPVNSLDICRNILSSVTIIILLLYISFQIVLRHTLCLQ